MTRPMDTDRSRRTSGACAGTRVILAVDDDAAVRQIASENLRRLGFIVIEAGDAGEAMRVLADPSCRVDLLFTDVRMPGPVSGPALAEMAARRQPALRILLTSGNPGSVDKYGALARIPVLGKPYRRADLAAAIEAALGAAPVAPA